MATLDPFIIQWPRQWIEDPEIGPVVHYLNRFLHDLFILSDDGSSFENEPANEALSALVATVINKVNMLELEPNNTLSRIAALEERIKNLELQQ